MADARRQDTPALRAIAGEAAFANLNNADAEIVVDLFLSYRDTEAFEFSWWATTTADNMAPIRMRRAAKGMETEHIQRMEGALRRAAG